jgi:hypothetical protein
MTTTPKKLGQMTLTGSGTQDTVYTVPAATSALIKSIHISNFSLANVRITLWHDGIANSNILLPPTVTILAGGFAHFNGNITMETGDTIRAEAGAASSLTITLHGVEFT